MLVLDLLSHKMHQQNPVDVPPESRSTTRIRRTPTQSCFHLQRVHLVIMNMCRNVEALFRFMRNTTLFDMINHKN